MIRREGANETWLLLSQVDHAHLAGEIAAVWGNDEVAALPEAGQLVPAVRDHDEGWSQWERTPAIDPVSGLPRNFTEMPMPVATDIWTQSILFCRQHSPLGAIWVSQHFTFLGENARESREDDSDDARAIDRFLSEQRAYRAACRAEIDDVPPADLETTIDVGFRWVRFFDAASLWLCCAERFDTDQALAPDGGALSLSPSPQTSNIMLEPWPLSVERLDLSVAARRIPARSLGSDAELQAAMRMADHETLEWSLVPGSEGA